jgi:hypothetical protein
MLIFLSQNEQGIGALPSPKSLFVDKYENDTHAPVYYQYDTYVAEFHKKRKMYTSSVADK